jgi:hydrogenase maturation protease
MMDNWLMNDSKAEERKILLIGIGNSGRGDDGVGWRFVDAISDGLYDFLDCEYRYQLQVEDADLITGYDTVLFVDASLEALKEGFEVRPCTPKGQYTFTSHALEPSAVVHLTNTLYHKYPEAYVLAIAGVEWELHTGLSKEAEDNLNAALGFFKENILTAMQQDRTVVAQLEELEDF